MGMGTLESKEFRTSLAQDKTQEALMFTDPMDPENLFTKHIKMKKRTTQNLQITLIPTITF